MNCLVTGNISKQLVGQPPQPPGNRLQNMMSFTRGMYYSSTCNPVEDAMNRILVKPIDSRQLRQKTRVQFIQLY